MAGMKGVRFSDEVHAKILSEAEQKKCSVSQIIRERIEQSYAQEEIKELKQKLSRMEARIIEIGPQARRAEHLSWWTIILLAEFIKHELGPEKFEPSRERPMKNSMSTGKQENSNYKERAGIMAQEQHCLAHKGLIKADHLRSLKPGRGKTASISRGSSPK